MASEAEQAAEMSRAHKVWIIAFLKAQPDMKCAWRLPKNNM